jgi:hypothetical protein
VPPVVVVDGGAPVQHTAERVGVSECAVKRTSLLSQPKHPSAATLPQPANPRVSWTLVTSSVTRDAVEVLLRLRSAVRTGSSAAGPLTDAGPSSDARVTAASRLGCVESTDHDRPDDAMTLVRLRGRYEELDLGLRSTPWGRSSFMRQRRANGDERHEFAGSHNVGPRRTDRGHPTRLRNPTRRCSPWASPTTGTPTSPAGRPARQLCPRRGCPRALLQLRAG